MKDNSKKNQDFVEVIKHKLDMMQASQAGQGAQLSMIRDQLSMMNSKLDAHSGALVSIEATLAGYADAYKVNKDNIERLDSRVADLEDKTDITPAPEFTIQR